MQRNRRLVFFTGIGLVVAGVVLAVLSAAGETESLRFIPLIAGVAICVAGAVSRVPGMYLPGMLLVGAGVGVVLVFSGIAPTSRHTVEGIFLVAIGGSLLLLPILSRCTGWKFVIWPIIPGSVLVLLGVGLLVSDPSGVCGGVFENAWRIGVALSVAYIVVAFLRRKSL